MGEGVTVYGIGRICRSRERTTQAVHTPRFNSTHLVCRVDSPPTANATVPTRPTPSLHFASRFLQPTSSVATSPFGIAKVPSHCIMPSITVDRRSYEVSR